MRLHVNFIRAKNESTQIRHGHFSAHLRCEIYLHRLRCLTLFLDFFNRSHVPVLLTVRSRLQGRVHDSGSRGRNDDSLHVRPSRLLLVNPRYPSHCENAPVLQRALENRIPTVPRLTGWHKSMPKSRGCVVALHQCISQILDIWRCSVCNRVHSFHGLVKRSWLPKTLSSSHLSPLDKRYAPWSYPQQPLPPTFCRKVQVPSLLP